jgi:UDP-glucose:(heptosyl)LPS alpha-1,3-glucosyltransferase
MERRMILRSELGISGKAPVWLWLGLQPRVKGLDRVIEALAQQLEVHLLVGGLSRGDRKAAAWDKRARQLGVDARIHWMGYASGERLFAAMAAADLLVHPARTDVTGGVILEAVINGLPAVVTELCGFSTHIAASGAGRVVNEPFSQHAFERAVSDLMAADLPDLSRRGIHHGSDPALYSGISVACDLIEGWSIPADRRRLMASTI